ncbi:MAG TPA: glycoside hydrolase family 3 C-terminal domain-containing protein, partial [Candidatus Lokiarchaeia archaeon]|nr:glycoside hydrolase family 3 C-terminal domain-containing protein [Candidatus Lokiarchaeia archaeon]
NLRPKANCEKIYGLTREYYPKQNFGGMMVNYIDETVDYNYRFETPDPTISNAQTAEVVNEQMSEKFSVKWKGMLCPDISGLYHIKVQGRGTEHTKKAKVKVGESPLSSHISIRLEEGHRYPIEVQFSHAGLGSSIHLKWKLPKFHSSRRNLNFNRELQAAKNSDVVLCYSGLSWGDEHEGIDRHDFNLSIEQQQLIKKIAAVNTNVVLILIAGSNLALNWEKENIPAIIHAWYPGERGGDAITNVIFGEYNPAGRIPLTFYRDVDQLPAFNEYDLAKGKTYWFLKERPLFAFGYGLSYTTFEYSDLTVDNTELTAEDKLSVNLKVRNTGEYNGDEVVQLYVSYDTRDPDTPLMQLKAFKRVHLAAGEIQDVNLNVDIAGLKFWNEQTKAYQIRTGNVKILVGSSSDDIRLETTVKIL